MTRFLGNAFIVVGVVLCLTIIGAFWGLPLIGVGALLKMAATRSQRAATSD